MEMRIGTGFDVHAFAPYRRLVLGGVDIPSSKGLDGHSDADVVLHALIDALLGAAAMGDIGMLFPDTDDAYKDISSVEFLSRAWNAIRDRGFRFVNCDVTIICQEPKLAPYTQRMRENIAGVLCADISRVSVKATTTEKLGFTGRGEGIAAEACAMLCADNGG